MNKDILTIFSLFFYHLFLIIGGLWIYCSFDIYSFCKIESIWLNVSLFGLTGGCIYCIRGLYIQYCVKRKWDNRWCVWHIIRPFVSAVCGVISLLFVKAGLLLFGISEFNTTQSHYVVYALSFIAGLNVDNFIEKIESIFKELIGIQKTRVSKDR